MRQGLGQNWGCGAGLRAMGQSVGQKLSRGSTSPSLPQSWVDEKTPWTTRYGSIAGLAELGHDVSVCPPAFLSPCVPRAPQSHICPTASSLQCPIPPFRVLSCTPLCVCVCPPRLFLQHHPSLRPHVPSSTPFPRPRMSS